MISTYVLNRAECLLNATIACTLVPDIIFLIYLCHLEHTEDDRLAIWNINESLARVGHHPLNAVDLVLIGILLILGQQELNLTIIIIPRPILCEIRDLHVFT